jgi:hypothetical protein
MVTKTIPLHNDHNSCLTLLDHGNERLQYTVQYRDFLDSPSSLTNAERLKETEPIEAHFHTRITENTVMLDKVQKSIT